MAHCKLDQMDGEVIEDHIHIAAFLSTVNDPKQAKAYWEKKTRKATLAEYIRATAEADKEMRRVQQPHTKPHKEKTESEPKEKVKDEPVGKVDRRKPKDKSTHRNAKTERSRKPKETHRYRCGKPDWTPDHGKNCKAKKATRKRCKKTGHFDKMCKNKLDKK